MSKEDSKKSSYRIDSTAGATNLNPNRSEPLAVGKSSSGASKLNPAASKPQKQEATPAREQAPTKAPAKDSK
jgi:hypothetical protein